MIHLEQYDNKVVEKIEFDSDRVIVWFMDRSRLEVEPQRILNTMAVKVSGRYFIEEQFNV